MFEALTLPLAKNLNTGLYEPYPYSVGRYALPVPAPPVQSIKTI